MKLSEDTIPALFDKTCRWRRRHELFADDRHRLTGAAALAAVQRATALLRARGIKPGDRIAILAGPSVAEAVGFFATMAAGAVPCSLHVRETTERNRANMDAIEAGAIMADEALLDEARAIAGPERVVLSVETLMATEMAGGPPTPRGADDLALILLSSGTTGAPKMIMHTHRTLRATAMTAGPIYGATTGAEAMIVPMAPSFAAWIHVVLPMMAIGARLYFQRRFDPDEYVDLLEREGATIAALVPSIWRMILPEVRRRRLPSLQVAMFSGEPGTPELVSALTARFRDVRSVYLASEGGGASGVVASAADLSTAANAGAAGRPIAQGDACVIDPDAAGVIALPTGEVGELALRGPSLSVGYLNMPELTEAKFASGWWRTGDLAFISPEGLLHICGRIDNRINSGGVKVHAEEIEAALRRLDMVRDVAVVGAPDPKWGERIEAHVVVADTALSREAIEIQLRKWLEESGALPGHMHPRRYHFHTILPYGPTGKLQRRALKSAGDAAPTTG